jgi:hypothetical protein
MMQAGSAIYRYVRMRFQHAIDLNTIQSLIHLQNAVSTAACRIVTVSIFVGARLVVAKVINHFDI